MTRTMRTIAGGVLGLSAACLIPVTATAQLASMAGAQTYHVSIGLAGGFTVPTGNATAPIKTGFNGQGYVLIHLLPGLPVLRFNIGYSRSSFSGPADGATSFSPNPFGTTREVLSGVGGLTFNLFHLGPVTPYLTAGVGAFDIRTSADTGTTGTGSTTGTTQSMLDFGIDGGAGLALRMGRVSAFAEGRVQNVYTKGGGLIKGAKQIQAVPVSFGIAVGVF
jgi:hypothetical protein